MSIFCYLQIMINLNTHLHGFIERFSPNRKNHKFLQQEHITKMCLINKTTSQSEASNLMTDHHIPHTCIASLFPACEPPLITLKAGTGRTRFLFPARLAICCIRYLFKLCNKLKFKIIYQLLSFLIMSKIHLQH